MTLPKYTVNLLTWGQCHRTCFVFPYTKLRVPGFWHETFFPGGDQSSCTGSHWNDRGRTRGFLVLMGLGHAVQGEGTRWGLITNQDVSPESPDGCRSSRPGKRWSDPFKGESWPPTFGDQKVTLNHLGYISFTSKTEISLHLPRDVQSLLHPGHTNIATWRTRRCISYWTWPLSVAIWVCQRITCLNLTLPSLWMTFLCVMATIPWERLAMRMVLDLMFWNCNMFSYCNFCIHTKTKSSKSVLWQQPL